MLILSDEKYHLENYGFIYHHWKVSKACGEHRHLYYEYMFVLSGTLVHAVNGVTQYLEANTLSLVRPNDYHSLGALNGKIYEYYNVMISIQEMDAMTHMFSGAGIRSMLDDLPVSPYFTMSRTEAANFRKNLDSAAGYSVYHPDFKALSRLLYSHILYQFYNQRIENSNTSLPQWFNKTLNEMQEKENFTAGLPALLKISGKTHEYLCRVFRKHLGYSPTAFITEMRLKYAKHLLLNTELPVIDIILDSGFNSISHFNHIFKDQNGCSPSAFRSQVRNLQMDNIIV